MRIRILFTVLVAASLGAATLRLPVAACITQSTPESQGCQPGSCANKKCCETSARRTSVPSPSLVKNGSSPDIDVAPLLAALGPAPAGIFTGYRLLSAPAPGTSPPARVLLCTFLI